MIPFGSVCYPFGFVSIQFCNELPRLIFTSSRSGKHQGIHDKLAAAAPFPPLL